MKKYKVIITGGGTGGHIFPAIAIARALNRKLQNIDILFVGDKNKMEMQKVPAAGFNIIGLPAIGLHRKFSIKNFIFPFRLLISLRKAKKIIKQFKPDAVIGVGGYASYAVAKTAANRKIPLLLQEQNSYPGISNRLLGKKANKICVAYEDMEKFFPKEKICITGNPVREEIKNVKLKYNESLTFFGIDKDKQTIFAMGGSLGAYTINKAINAVLPVIALNNVQLIWQTGQNYYETALAEINCYKNNSFRVFKFIERVDLALAAADLVIARAGAITVSELCIAKKAAVLIPSPNVAANHQTKNAMFLTKADAAILLSDEKATAELGNVLIALLHDKNKLERLRTKISKFGIADADEKIADEIIKLIKNKVKSEKSKTKN